MGYPIIYIGQRVVKGTYAEVTIPTLQRTFLLSGLFFAAIAKHFVARRWPEEEHHRAPTFLFSSDNVDRNLVGHEPSRAACNDTTGTSGAKPVCAARTHEIDGHPRGQRPGTPQGTPWGCEPLIH